MSDTAMEIYQLAWDISASLYSLPYQAPSDVSKTVRADDELMTIISGAYRTTINECGERCQTTISAAERIRLQNIFKLKIYQLLSECLKQNPHFAPAFLLYTQVAEFNSRAPDRENIIAIYEIFLPLVDSVVKGSLGYEYIQSDINKRGFFGNFYNKVERHTADFYCALAELYIKDGRIKEAKSVFQKANKACPQIYGKGKDRIYPF
ncbi:MAG: tetratricopeptide repeat protein [Cellvibrio sp.]